MNSISGLGAYQAFVTKENCSKRHSSTKIFGTAIKNIWKETYI